MRNLLLLCLLIFWGASCHSDVAGGGPSGTEAGNAITAQILRKDFSPAAAARVFVMPSNSLEGLEDVALATALTDKEGRFTVKNLPMGRYTVEVSDVSGALQFKAEVDDSTSYDRGHDTLRAFSAIEGSVGFESAGIIKFQGTRHRRPVDAKGFFSFDSLPSGFASLVFMPSEETLPYFSYGNLSPGFVTTPSTFAAEKEHLLLADFEGLNTQHRYAPYVGDSTGWWYLVSHEGISLEFGDSLLSGYPLVKEESQYIAFSFTVSPEVLNPWVNFGIQIGGNESTYDLNGLDSIAFKTKGSGTVILQLLGAEASVGLEDIGDWPQLPIDLPEKWTRIAVPISELAPSSEQLKEVRLVAWVFTAKADFSLDDVEFIGISKEEIWFK